jgi:hypothetical protein
MIIYRQWETFDKKGRCVYNEGYFLFGLIPLYIRRYSDGIASLIQVARRGPYK